MCVLCTGSVLCTGTGSGVHRSSRLGRLGTTHTVASYPGSCYSATNTVVSSSFNK